MADGLQETAAATGGAAVDDQVKPYQLHISSRYLDLTKQKLELTRLPHESSDPKSEDWWEPKPQVEPLIDYWLEQYSWRAREEAINARLPQFRTAITLSSVETPLRIHFVHIPSSRPDSVPLLILPPFPLTNLSIGPVVDEFARSESVSNGLSFDLVIPSLPGVGFSDALPNGTPVLSATAELLNSLMGRLSYSHYLVTNTAPGSASPAEIDYSLANLLIHRYPHSCLGAHLISPPIARPKLKEAPLEWAKYAISSFLNSPMLGYRSEDFSALARTGPAERPHGGKGRLPTTPAQLGLNQFGLREPNTLAYALCDSPTGLLVLVMRGLRLLGARRQFSPAEMVDFAQLAWLPGPEAAMRFWAFCSLHPTDVEWRRAAARPNVAITVFLGDDDHHGEEEQRGQAAAGSTDAEAAAPDVQHGDETGNSYSCPSWGRPKYRVVYTHRASGRPGLLAWERPGLIVAGVQGLAAAVRKADARLRREPEPATVPLTQVVAEGEATGGGTGDAPAPSIGEPARPDPAHLAPPAVAAPQPEAEVGERGHPHREISGETTVASSENLAKSMPSSPSASPAAVQDPGLLAPPTAHARSQPHRELSDETKVASTESIPGKAPTPGV